MRIRKGPRCLSLPSADRPLASPKRTDGANQALLNLVALAVADNIIGSPQEHATCMEGKKLLEPELENKRVSVDNDLNYHFPMCNAGVASIMRESTATPPKARSVVTTHEPLDTTGTISSSTSSVKIQHQPDLLEQSLCYICSRAGTTGLSVRDAVAQIIQQGLPGLNGVGEGLIEQVKKAFFHSSKFVECKEHETFYLRGLPASKEDKSLATRDSELHHKKMDPSIDMLGAAEQLQYLQKSHSNSVVSSVVEPSDSPSVHGGKHNKARVRQSKIANFHKDVVTRHNSSSSASGWQKGDGSVFQCVREDGKQWRCSQPAEAGFAMCSYHRNLVNQGKERRKRTRMETGPKPSSKYVANKRVMKDSIVTDTDWNPFSDDELSFDEHRQYVKAKSMASLLLSSGMRRRR